jgi:peptidoglycan/xylan/chitin deacetylase (PgdA/CDA1 family)
MFLKQKLLMLMYSSLYLSGASRAYSKFSNTESAVILMYHSVSSETDRKWIDPDNDMPEDIFEEQMRYIHENCKVVSIDHLCNCIRNNSPIEPKTVVVTFDDGYRNNLENAARILNKYKLPAIIYLATGYISHGETQWIDELYSYFKYRTLNYLELYDLGKLDISTHQGAKEAYESLKYILLASDVGDRRLLLDQVKEQLCPSSVSPRLTLIWQELSERLKDYPNITLGVHTKNHLDLTSLGQEAIDNQINQSISDVSKNLRLEVNHFSYPYGQWNQAIRSRVEQAGLLSAVATEPVPAVTTESDPYSLPRIEAPRNMALFKYMVSGAYPKLSQALFRRPMEVVGKD